MRSDGASVLRGIGRSGAIGSIAIAAQASAAPSPAALHFDFVRVVDTTQSPPDRPTVGYVQFEDKDFVIDDGRVLFLGWRDPAEPSLPSNGLYLWCDGQVTTIVESADVPFEQELTSQLRSIGAFSMHGDTIAYSARSNSAINPADAVYVMNGGAATRVLDPETALVNDPRRYVSPGFLRVENGVVVLSANLDDGGNAILTVASSEPARVLVDNATVFPGQSAPYQFLGAIGGFENGLLTVAPGFPPPGQGGRAGGYYTLDLDGNLAVVADATSTFPDSDAPFLGFQDLPLPSISGNTVAFSGAGFDPQGVIRHGIYARNLSTGELSIIADSTSIFPEVPNGVVQTVGSPSIDGDNAAFIGSGGVSFSALLLKREGEIMPVIAEGETLFGREINFLSITHDSLEADSIVFYASFTDGESGLYLAKLVPAPTGFAVLALTPLALARASRRRARPLVG